MSPAPSEMARIEEQLQESADARLHRLVGLQSNPPTMADLANNAAANNRRHIDRLVNASMEKRSTHIEDLCRHHVLATGADPSKLVLVETHEGSTIRWHVEERS